MPTYVLNYFPIGGRALAARLMFKIAGVEFTDNHITGEEWAKAKENSKSRFSSCVQDASFFGTIFVQIKPELLICM